MTFHLYVRPDGFPEISDFLIHPEMCPGYQYLGESETVPNVYNKHWVNGAWVDTPLPEYEEQRKAYPSNFELMKALWHAMDTGVLPKVEGFYDRIAEVHKRFPEK